MSANDLDARGRQAAAAVRARVREMELASAPGPRATGPAPRWVLIGAIALVVVVAGLLVVVRGGADSEEGGIASSGGATRLAPTWLPEGMTFSGAAEGPVPVDEDGATELTVYAGPEGSDVVVIGLVSRDPITDGGEDPREGEDWIARSWLEVETGRTLNLQARGVTSEQVDAMVAATTSDERGGVTIADDALPAGVTRVGTVPIGVVSPNVSALATEPGVGVLGYASDDPERLLEIAFAPAGAGWFEAAAPTVPDGRSIEVRGQRGVVGAFDQDAAAPTMLVWVEPDGTFVRLVGFGLDEDELVAIAEGMAPLSDAEWQELLDRTGQVTTGEASVEGTQLEAPATTFEDVGEPLPTLTIEGLDDGTDRVRLRMSHDATSELVTSAAQVGELPHAWAEDGWIYGVAPANARDVSVESSGWAYATTAFVPVAGDAPRPLRGYALRVTEDVTTYSITVRLEDGSEITVDGSR